MVIYHELVMTTKEFMRSVVEIKPEWLLEVAVQLLADGCTDIDRTHAQSNQATTY